MSLIVAGKDPAKCIAWQTRRARYGPQGYANGHHHAGGRVRSTHCKRGHKRQGSEHQCRSCRRIWKGAAIRRQLKAGELLRKRAAMIAAHPDKGGTHEKFLKAQRVYLTAQRAT